MTNFLQSLFKLETNVDLLKEQNEASFEITYMYLLKHDTGLRFQ